MLRFARWILVGVASSTFGLGDEGGTTPPDRTAILAEFPIRDEKKPLVVPVVFRGRTYSFVLDTGASHVIYDQSLEGQLGPPLRTRTLEAVSGTVTLPAYASPEATLGPLDLRTDEFVVCADLSGLSAGAGHRIHGMIGMAFLKNYVVNLDYSHRKIQFRREVDIADDQARPIEYTRLGCPMVEVTLRDEPARSYKLDTGACGLGGTTVETATYERLIDKVYAKAVTQSLQMDLAGTRVGRIAEVFRAEVAGVELRRIYVSESPQEGKFLLGLDAIRRLDWVLDFPKGRMQVTPIGAAPARR